MSNFTPIVQRLKDRGPVPVSPDNPYLAANLLLSKSKEQHPELKGFLDAQGNPPAIKVSSSLFKPLLLTLFYPQNSEYFVAELASDSQSFINGPYSITDDEKTELSRLRIKIPSPSPRPIETPSVESKESDKKALKAQQIKPIPTPLREEKFAPPSTHDEQAEISPRGDVVHYVTDQSEKINDIARWYTGDETNADKILRLNNITALAVGDSVIIPSYLVKQKARMPGNPAR